MPTERIGIDGVDEFLAALTEIGDKIALRTIKKASRKACAPLFQATRQQCPVDTGTLKDSIDVKLMQQKKKGFAGAQVITGKGFYKGETYYGGMVEFGHKMPNGTMVPPNPFMSRAVQMTKHEVLETMSDTIKHDIEEAAKAVKVKNNK